MTNKEVMKLIKQSVEKAIVELKEEQKPFDYSQEAEQIKELEEKIIPLANRQISKKQIFDEYQNKIDSLIKSIRDIDLILNPDGDVEDIENEDIEEVDVVQ